MKAFDEYAYIFENKVKNIAVFDTKSAAYTLANKMAQATYGPSAIAINVTYCPVAIGDDYINGRFSRDGVFIDYYPSDEEKIASLNVQVEQQSNDIDDLIISLTPSLEVPTNV